MATEHDYTNTLILTTANGDAVISKYVNAGSTSLWWKVRSYNTKRVTFQWGVGNKTPAKIKSKENDV